MKRSLLMVQLRDRRTGKVCKVHGLDWISAGYFMQLRHDGKIEPDKYSVTYKRREIKCRTK